MKEVLFDLGRKSFPIRIPDRAEVLSMGRILPLSNPAERIRSSLAFPIGSPPLKKLIAKKLQANPAASAVVVISDSTRPVPYSGESGILYPVLEEIVRAGLHSSRIVLLVATGTHRAMTKKELQKFLDPRISAMGVAVLQHNCRKSSGLVSVGKTELGGEILINRTYVEGDIKILTGLVESHFMAGVSGGRKSICPGLLAENSTHILHSGPILSSPNAADLILDGNPVHEEALRAARLAGCDMIVNVTIDPNYRLTGVFSGDMEKAHLNAYEKLRSYAAIPASKKYDIVLTHTGFTGVNHYQAAKGALVCSPILQNEGICLLAAFHPDTDPIGSENYKKMMHILGEKGSFAFLKMINDPSWRFVPEQWEAQMWTRLFTRIPPENLIYCTFDIPEEDFSWLPGTDARKLTQRVANLQKLVEGALDWAVKRLRMRLGRDPDIAVLPDGPYGIPFLEKLPFLST